MKAEICFRPAKDGDAEVIAQLRQQVWNTTYRGIYPDEVIDCFDLEWHTARNLKWIQHWKTYVIEASGKPIGYLIFQVKDLLYLQSLYLIREWQGKGVGKAAFALLKACCMEHEIKTIRWQCSPWNLQALGFYRGMGAVITDRDEGHKCKQEDSLWFEMTV